jgi:hypothetical protein
MFVVCVEGRNIVTLVWSVRRIVDEFVRSESLKPPFVSPGLVLDGLTVGTVMGTHGEDKFAEMVGWLCCVF